MNYINNWWQSRILTAIFFYNFLYKNTVFLVVFLSDCHLGLLFALKTLCMKAINEHKHSVMFSFSILFLYTYRVPWDNKIKTP